MAAVYLRGPNCKNEDFVTSQGDPGKRTFGLLHEILHTLGAAVGANMNICQGHVLDEPEDLMYAGDQHWIPGKLDIGRHDYYAMKNPSPGAVDVSRSAFPDAAVGS